MSEPKRKHLVIDTSVYINYTRHQKLNRLIDAILSYDLVVYISPDLIDELVRNIPLTSAVELPQFVYDGYLQTIKSISVLFQPVPQYADSPDPKDNFLWDLALQPNSEIIVTKENALLGFSNSPIPVHDIKWFKETYPVSF
jgi:putative PIN family toxin of toxin-antitoxin system